MKLTKNDIKFLAKCSRDSRESFWQRKQVHPDDLDSPMHFLPNSIREWIHSNGYRVKSSLTGKYFTDHCEAEHFGPVFITWKDAYIKQHVGVEL